MGLRELRNSSPEAVRVIPFVLFLLLTSGQGQFGPTSPYWLYLIKIVVGLGLLLWMRPVVKEMRWAFSGAAVAVGVGVFALWVGLDGMYPTLDALWHKIRGGEAPKASPIWNPHDHFSSGLAWLFVLVRLVGSTLVVPPLEEVFYRSFLYRYVISPRFNQVPLGQWNTRAFLFTCVVFGVAHREWLAGILSAAAYQGLVIYKKRLGDAMTAHAITNFLLGLWVLWRQAWIFW